MSNDWLEAAHALSEALASRVRPEPFQADWRYRDLQALVLANGLAFQPHPRPTDVRGGTFQQCFWNAQKLVKKDPARFVYVEGYGIHMGNTPMHHAWCLDLGTGMAVDNTWGVAQALFGVPIKTEYLRQVWREKRENTSLLDIWELGWPMMTMDPADYLQPTEHGVRLPVSDQNWGAQ